MPMKSSLIPSCRAAADALRLGSLCHHPYFRTPWQAGFLSRQSLALPFLPDCSPGFSPRGVVTVLSLRLYSFVALLFVYLVMLVDFVLNRVFGRRKLSCGLLCIVFDLLAGYKPKSHHFDHKLSGTGIVTPRKRYYNLISMVLFACLSL